MKKESNPDSSSETNQLRNEEIEWNIGKERIEELHHDSPALGLDFADCGLSILDHHLWMSRIEGSRVASLLLSLINRPQRERESVCVKWRVFSRGKSFWDGEENGFLYRREARDRQRETERPERDRERERVVSFRSYPLKIPQPSQAPKPNRLRTRNQESGPTTSPFPFKNFHFIIYTYIYFRLEGNWLNRCHTWHIRRRRERI